MNNRVLVVEDPVKWRTFVRKNGVEPEKSEREDAVPFFLAADNSARFTPEEERSIKDCMSSSGVLLVRQGMPGTQYVRIGGECDELISCFTNTELIVPDLVTGFLLHLGGSNICVHKDLATTKQQTEESKCESGTKGCVNGVGEGEIKTNREDQKTSKNRGAVRMDVSIAKTDANFRCAEEVLSYNPWMRSRFKMLLDKAKSGEIHGHYEQSFSISSASELASTLTEAVDVAAKYKIVDSKFKVKIHRKVEAIEKRDENWKYSIDFPDNKADV